MDLGRAYSKLQTWACKGRRLQAWVQLRRTSDMAGRPQVALDMCRGQCCQGPLLPLVCMQPRMQHQTQAHKQRHHCSILCQQEQQQPCSRR